MRVHGWLKASAVSSVLLAVAAAAFSAFAEGSFGRLFESVFGGTTLAIAGSAKPHEIGFLGAGSAEFTAPKTLRLDMSVNVILEVSLENKLKWGEVTFPRGNPVLSKSETHEGTSESPPITTRTYGLLPIYDQMSAKLDAEAFDYNLRDWEQQNVAEGWARWTWNIRPRTGMNGTQPLTIQIQANQILLATLTANVEISPAEKFTPSTLLPRTDATQRAPTPTPVAGPSDQVFELSILVEPANAGYVEIQGSGTVTSGGATPFKYNEQINLVARAIDDNWRFDHWEGDVSGSRANLAIVMNGSRMVRAVFVPIGVKIVTTRPTLAPKPTDAFRLEPVVRLQFLNEEITRAQDGLVEVFVTNSSVNDVVMNLELFVSLPSGIRVFGEGFASASSAGTMRGFFEVPPGTSRTIALNIAGVRGLDQYAQLKNLV